MIKQAIKNSEKNYLIEDEKYKDILDLRISFFEAIPEYMLPLLSIFAIYYFAFLAWVMTTIKLAEKFIGKIDFLLENLKTIQVSTASALEYIQNLPTEQLKILYEWQTFLILSIAIFGIFTLFLPPALYFEKNNKKNPLRAFLNSFKVFFKKPVEIIIFNVVIGILFFIMMLLQALCSANLVLYFFYFLISTWLTTYFVVLLFNYYDKRFAYNSNNRADSFREN
ncbi:MAG: hypothetical protein E7Z91_03650 [Cyanobacteria bacterium SIG30]|nr:hypothetical protein [Cyanobacteria bacterium SIG30]